MLPEFLSLRQSAITCSIYVASGPENFTGNSREVSPPISEYGRRRLESSSSFFWECAVLARTRETSCALVNRNGMGNSPSICSRQGLKHEGKLEIDISRA